MKFAFFSRKMAKYDLNFSQTFITFRQVSGVMSQVSLVTCNMSGVACHMSPVNYHLSLTPTATATDPPPDNSHIMHSRLVPKVQKNQQISKHKNSLKQQKHKKMPKDMQKFAICSLTRDLQSTKKHRYIIFYVSPWDCGAWI